MNYVVQSISCKAELKRVWFPVSKGITNRWIQFITGKFGGVLIPFRIQGLVFYKQIKITIVVVLYWESFRENLLWVEFGKTAKYLPLKNFRLYYGSIVPNLELLLVHVYACMKLFTDHNIARYDLCYFLHTSQKLKCSHWKECCRVLSSITDNCISRH